MIVYKNKSDYFDTGYCSLKVKVTVLIYSTYVSQYKCLNSKSQLWHMWGTGPGSSPGGDASFSHQ